MRKFLLLFFAVAAVNTIVQSQIQKLDTLRGITKEQFNTILNQQFRTLLTGYTGPSVGSFAALDLSESKKVTFAPTFVLKNGNLITGKFNAGITEGFAEIFNNSSLNTNISFDLEYNAIGFKNRKSIGPMLILDRFEREKFKKKEREIEEAFAIDSAVAKTGYKRREIVRKLAADTVILDSLYLKYKHLVVAELSWRIGTGPRPAYRLSTLTLDSLSDTLGIIDVKLKIARNAIADNTIAETAWIKAKMIELKMKRASDLEQYEETNLTVHGFRFGWFTFGAQVRNDDFKLFDPTKALPEERLISEKFVSGELRAKYSIYQWSPKHRPYFLSFGLAYKYKSNYSDLTSVDVSVTNGYPAYTDTAKTVSAVEKYTAYTGEYKPFMDELIIDFDFYYFFTKKNTFAVHFYPNLRITSIIKPTLNVGIGILYPFKDSKEEKSIVNAEIYYNFIDLTQSTKDDLRLYKQNKIGIRFSFPINFKNS